MAMCIFGGALSPPYSNSFKFVYYIIGGHFYIGILVVILILGVGFALGVYHLWKHLSESLKRLRSTSEAKGSSRFAPGAKAQGSSIFDSKAIRRKRHSTYEKIPSDEDAWLKEKHLTLAVISSDEDIKRIDK
jgi:hypothetical protein